MSYQAAVGSVSTWRLMQRRVADGARIGDGVEIGPYCVVGPHVELKDGVRLFGQVNVTGVTTVGEGTVIYPFASLGLALQSVHYRGDAKALP
jgi:UDP-N-acetylglucosamine acyltransferase